MKRIFLSLISVLLVFSILAGCSKAQPEPPAEPSATPTTSTTTPSDENTTVDIDLSRYVDAAYVQQVERYYTAVSNQWNEGDYIENEMSSLAAYYYEGDALENIGFTCMDFNGDNVQELVIGAIQNAGNDPLVFEIWTLNNDEPVMLAQSGARNRYYMRYAEDDDMWSVAYEAENGAANHAVYYLNLTDGEFEVTQGVVFDAVANESAPWFMAYDLDWDVSNDTPIDEDTANAVTEAGRKIYTPVAYFPYSICK